MHIIIFNDLFYFHFHWSSCQYLVNIILLHFFNFRFVISVFIEKIPPRKFGKKFRRFVMRLLKHWVAGDILWSILGITRLRVSTPPVFLPLDRCNKYKNEIKFYLCSVKISASREKTSVMTWSFFEILYFCQQQGHEAHRSVIKGKQIFLKLEF